MAHHYLGAERLGFTNSSWCRSKRYTTAQTLYFRHLNFANIAVFEFESILVAHASCCSVTGVWTDRDPGVSPSSPDEWAANDFPRTCQARSFAEEAGTGGGSAGQTAFGQNSSSSHCRESMWWGTTWCKGLVKTQIKFAADALVERRPGRCIRWLVKAS